MLQADAQRHSLRPRYLDATAARKLAMLRAGIADDRDQASQARSHERWNSNTFWRPYHAASPFNFPPINFVKAGIMAAGQRPESVDHCLWLKAIIINKS
ncbi:MAG: hypothetical protein R3C99_07245 [Pirellulaceae bacterium]